LHDGIAEPEPDADGHRDGVTYRNGDSYSYSYCNRHIDT
jgi:hypothetical protein